jgi:indolepyruvate ferredoxin oxidoreductase beta subunit
MKETKNILLVGVGGQGTILASKILAQGLLEEGYDVKMSEIHGMSQRGGSVSTQIRYGEKVFSPIIGDGDADIVVSFEVMETARWIRYAKPDAKIIVNDYRIYPLEVLSGKSDYPETTIADLSAGMDVQVIAANEIATKLGNPKAMNIVLLGALIRGLGLEDINWDAIIAKQVKPAFVELNQKALKAGMEAR